MSLTIFQVDSFTSEPFRGNPAGVCVTETPIPDNRMQQLAAEMNVAETAFLVRQSDGAFSLRWFTPEVEVDLCGHATLASAHILWESGLLSASDTARFDTKSGRLTARKVGNRIELDFPSEPPQPTAPSDAILRSLGLSCATFTGRNRMDHFIRVDDERVVRELDPDVAALGGIDARGVIVTAQSKGEYDFVSRFFAPAVGIAEDPVTGSAHCALAPYWSAKLGKPIVTGYQASARGGVVECEPRGDRVLLRGAAVTTMRCEVVV
jgi:PhzF family phenazine biosynthesis protein